MRGTAIRRIVSASSAGTLNMAVSMIFQIASVPIFLSNVGAEGFGTWVMVLSIFNLVKVPDVAHQDYVGREFLRLEDDGERSRVLSESLFNGFCIGGIFILIGAVLLGVPQFWVLERTNSVVVPSVGVLLLSWGFSGSLYGILHRRLAFDGYFPLFAWYGVALRALEYVGVIVFLIFSKSVFFAAVGQSLGRIAFVAAVTPFVLRIFKREAIELRVLCRGLWRKLAIQSQWLTLINFIRDLRGQGLRVVLGALQGSAELAVFAAMRSGAGIAYCGIGIFVGPLQPEIMKFLRAKDERRAASMMSAFWFGVILCFSPVVILMQAYIEPIFLLWTRGEIAFDPPLFAVLSAGVVIFALSQPALLVVQGNNLLRSLVKLSGLSGAFLLAALFAVVPTLGILSAGVILMATELMVLIGLSLLARKWFARVGMEWPLRNEKNGYLGLIITLAALIVLSQTDCNRTLVVLASLLALCFPLAQILSTDPLIFSFLFSRIKRR